MRKETKLDTSPRVLSRTPNRVRREVLDLTNDHYGELTVLRFAGVNKRGSAYWDCSCSCGNTITTSSQSLRAGAVKSCGHISLDKASDRMRVMSKTHGASNEPWYSNYTSMIQRTTKPKTVQYHEYRERHPNITKWIEPEWVEDPWAFYKEIGDKPSKEYSIDRIDNEKGYVKGNMRWATWLQQANNKSLQARSNSGFVGVRLLEAGTNKRAVPVYQASITHDNKSWLIGHYDDIEDAKIARWREEERLGVKHTFDIIANREPVKHIPVVAKTFINLELGTVVGELTITSQIDSSTFKCTCSCGAEVVRSKSNILARDYMDCGDYTKHPNKSKTFNGTTVPSQRNDYYKGRTYGSLTLIRYTHTASYNVYWDAQCACGNTINVTIGSLTSGHTKTCGHSKYKYTVVAPDGAECTFKSIKELRDHFKIKSIRTEPANITYTVSSKRSKLYGYSITKTFTIPLE